MPIDHNLPSGDAPSSDDLNKLIAPFESKVLDDFNQENKPHVSITIPIVIAYARPPTPEELGFYSRLQQKNRIYRIIKYIIAFSIAVLLGLLSYGLGATLL